MNKDQLGLVGDIGATHARFAMVDPSSAIANVRVMPCGDHPSLAAALTAYLQDVGPSAQGLDAVLAIAAPATGDVVTFTNRPWTFSIEALRRQFGLRHLRIINDFAANALAVPHLGETDCEKVGGGAPIAQAPIGVIGPGSGLGVGALVATNGRAIPIQSEGGHVTMPAADARESAVLEVLRLRFGHVSAERVLSGPGLVNLYGALCELSGVPSAHLTAEQITDAGIDAEDACANEAKAMFCGMLGTVAGNLALTLGARGGIYIAGGIVPKLGAAFSESTFRARFESKGRLTRYVAAIPTYVIVHPYPALIGAAKLLEWA